MRAFRKRPWAELMVNMTPLIDVVFLLIIFFILMINFTEMNIRNVLLPKADEARESRTDKLLKIPITIRTDGKLYLDRRLVRLEDLGAALAQKLAVRKRLVMEIRADEELPYEYIKKVMMAMARANISEIEFATFQDAPVPLEKDGPDESPVSH